MSAAALAAIFGLSSSLGYFRVASAIAGDNLGYLLGRHFGRDVFVARGPLHHHRERAVAYGDRFFEKHGARAVFLARWIALGGITWGITYGLVGYYAGDAAGLLGGPAGAQLPDRLDVSAVQV